MSKAEEELFRNFIRSEHLTAKWEAYLTANQPELSEVKCSDCEPISGFFLGTTCRTCLRPFRAITTPIEPLQTVEKLPPTKIDWNSMPNHKDKHTQTVEDDHEQLTCNTCEKITLWINGVCSECKPHQTVEEIKTGIRPSWDDDTTDGFQAFFTIGVQTFSIGYVGTKEQAKFMQRMAIKAFGNIKGVTKEGQR